MPLAPITPFTSAKINSILEISKNAAPDMGLVPGETLQTTVVEKVAANKYLLALKNLVIPASSELPLNPGDKLLVKVTSIQPQIILSMLDPEKAVLDQKVNEKLLYVRSNPDSLLQLLNKVADLSKTFEQSGLSAKFPASEIEKLVKLFDSIIYSSRTITNKLFIKDFLSQSGLLFEHSLANLAAQGEKGASKPLEDNIKTLLIKLSAVVQAELLQSKGLDPQITAKLTALNAFTTDGLKTIEARQALNVVFQESDHGLALQIPVACGDTIRMIDLFIRPEEKNAQGEYSFSSCSIVIFLDLDVLGKISINAGIREGVFRSVIKCESEEVRELLTHELSRLETALGTIGYRVESLECLQETALTQNRDEFLAQQSFSACDVINYFA